MPDYEAVVSRIKEDGSAEVLVVPGRSHVPGASGLRVCNCATDNSSVPVKALNRAGAGKGDMVLVHLEGRDVARNFTAFLVTPFAGAAAGLFAGQIWTWQGAVPIAVGLGFIVGCGSGLWIYRRKKREISLVVTKVLASAEESGKIFATPAGGAEKCSACRQSGDIGGGG